MAKTKKKSAAASDVLRPYVTRALEDPQLRDDLIAALAAARSLYGQLGKQQGMKEKAARISGGEFQEQLQEFVAELSSASDRLQGKKAKKVKSHKRRNRVVFLTGVTLGVLFNPWTGPTTRKWITTQVSGSDSVGLEELMEKPAAETEPISAPSDAADA
jgi:type II secretory pathway pseudopilin PulG